MENRKAEKEKKAEISEIKEVIQKTEIEENITTETEIDDETIAGMVVLAHVMAKDKYHEYRIVTIEEIAN